MGSTSASCTPPHLRRSHPKIWEEILHRAIRMRPNHIIHQMNRMISRTESEKIWNGNSPGLFICGRGVGGGSLSRFGRGEKTAQEKE